MLCQLYIFVICIKIKVYMRNKDLQFSNLINPNWSDLEEVKSKIYKSERGLKGKMKVLKDDKVDDSVFNMDYETSISTKVVEISIRHRDGIYMYNGSKYASISYDLMITNALIDLMFKQEIKGGNNDISGVFGYINLNSVGLKFIVDYFDKKFAIQSYHNMSYDKRLKKIKSLINNLIYYGFLTKVYRVNINNEVEETKTIYAISIFDIFNGLQIDKLSYCFIKKERQNFIKKNPNINYKDYINKADPLKIKRINIDDLECINVYLVTIIKTYKDQLSYSLENGISNGIKMNISLLSKEHGCTRRIFETRINELIKNQDLIETRKGCYILNPERYCV